MSDPAPAVLDLIGNTPLVRVTRLDTGPCALFLKLDTAVYVGIGTSLFYDPMICKKINTGIEEYLRANGMNDVTELVGSLNTAR